MSVRIVEGHYWRAIVIFVPVDGTIDGIDPLTVDGSYATDRGVFKVKNGLGSGECELCNGKLERRHQLL